MGREFSWLVRVAGVAGEWNTEGTMSTKGERRMIAASRRSAGLGRSFLGPVTPLQPRLAERTMNSFGSLRFPIGGSAVLGSSSGLGGGFV